MSNSSQKSADVSKRVPGQNWHSLPVDQVLGELKTSANGLNASEVNERRTQWGSNELEEAPPPPLWKKLLSQFKDLVVWILLVAAVISGAMGDWVEALAIVAIVLINGLIGFFQEERASRALAALKKLSSPQAKTVRNGHLQTIPASELVPGDRIELEAGDNIPADVRLAESFSLQVQESALTGESTPVEKDAAATVGQDAGVSDRVTMAYMGTVATSGKSSAVVVATGMNTELGHIAEMLEQSEPEQTPLQIRLTELGRILVYVCLGIAALIFLLEMLRGRELLKVLLVSVSLAVAAVPEGLPAVVTMVLALGLQQMVKHQVLVRKLPSVETLGSVTVICSDKTGTLTHNEMTVREVFTATNHYQVTGTGYVPEGKFQKFVPSSTKKGETYENVKDEPVDAKSDQDLMELLNTGAVCNNSELKENPNAKDDWSVIGDPTEGALVVLARKAHIAVERDKRSLVHEIPFDSDRKLMSVIVKRENGPPRMYTKGAPETLLPKCTSELRNGESTLISDARRSEIAKANSQMAERALRTLALAFRDCPDADATKCEENNFTLVGIVGMSDPPREEAKQAVNKCREAGVRPVMITGDHPVTALAIARELHIASDDDKVLSGKDLEQINDDQLIEQVEKTAVYARVSPKHKLRIVKALKKRGEIVAMTGDGVNDAPSIKAADIGIAMGITGTDVTKEASDMILMDDNFTSIVNAIEKGRGIFDNIQKFVHYLLATNAGEVFLLLIASLIGWPLPLLAVQILWINLATDSLPALALGVEIPEKDIMQRPPRPPQESVITMKRGLIILANGLLIAVIGMIGFWSVYRGEEANLERARTMTFCVMAFSQLFFAFGCRSQHHTLPELGFFTNRYLFTAILISTVLQVAIVMLPIGRKALGIAAPLENEWWLVALLSVIPVTVVEISKLIRARVLRSIAQN